MMDERKGLIELGWFGGMPPHHALTRFDANIRNGKYDGMAVNENGGWVLFEHAEELRKALAQQAQEIERIQKELDHHVRQRCYATEENLKLKREVERLKGELQKEYERANEYFDLCTHKDTQLAAMTAERDEAWMRFAATFSHDDFITSLDDTLLIHEELKDQYAQLQATLAERERDIDKLKADLNEMWVDDKGTVWTKPTAWAYAMVCKARDKHAQDAARLRMLIFRLLNDLPTKRDWLDPDLEKALKGA